MGWRLYILATFAASLVSFSSNFGFAQIALEKQTDLGLWQVSIEPDKTTFIGAYGQFVAPYVSQEWEALRGESARGHASSAVSAPTAAQPIGNSSVGVPTAASTSSSASAVSGSASPLKNGYGFMAGILPGGRLPRNLQLAYAGTVGWRASLMFQPTQLKLWNGLSPQILLSYFFDDNAMAGFAPTGVGALTDPIRASAAATIFGCQEEVRIPVYAINTTSGGAYTFLLGQGWMWEHSQTSALANSSFLDLAINEKTSRVAPLFSLTTELRPNWDSFSALSVPNGVKFSGVDINFFTMKTEYMWTVGVSAGLVWRM